MIVFERWIQSVEHVRDTMRETVKDSLQEPLIASQIPDLNVEQMDLGIDHDGRAISPAYKPLTIAIKQIKGQPTYKVTLKDEGDFHSSVKVEFTTDDFRLYATDPKTPKLGKKYGYQIFGLTDKNLDYIRDEVLPYLIDDVRKKLFK